jgi:hypothetical protein
MSSIRADRGHQALSVGDDFPEIILINSHMGICAFLLLLGWFRSACLNGLVVGNALFGHRVPHVGFADSHVDYGLTCLLYAVPKIADEVAAWKHIQLTRDAQLAYADAAISLRFEAEKFAVEPEAVLRPKRIADTGTDLFTTFNVVQENLIRGGIRTQNQNGARVSSRAITSVDENVRLNRSLWTLTQNLASMMQL